MFILRNNLSQVIPSYRNQKRERKLQSGASCK